jgi:Ni/Co efflux regulator RcnB
MHEESRMSLRKPSLRFAALAAFAIAAATCQAAKPQPKQEEQPQAAPAPAQTSGYGVKLGGFFNDKHKDAVKRSFAQHYAKTKECPKDMERKGKTCRALVQGHYWAVGQPLRSEVETFPLPDDVQAHLPKPPDGYEYVRAGDDILLISKSLHLVVDVMQDVMG